MLLARTLTCLAIFASCASAQEITVRSEPIDKTQSELLRPPGQSPGSYGKTIDWARVPSWRQTSFFNVRAEGKTFIYVVDCSGSMAHRERLLRAKRELRRSTNDMRFPQRFLVIFYNDQPIAMPGGIPQLADRESRSQLASWLDVISPDGATDPREAMTRAIQLKPDGIFLLSDGEFPDGSIATIAKQNTTKIPIHCVDMSGQSQDLKKIAKDSGGEYVARP